MSDSIQNEILLDASDALRTFKVLETVVNAYTSALKGNSNATGQFNQGQQGIESILDTVAAGFKNVRAEAEAATKAQKDAIAQAKKAEQIARTGRQLDARRNAYQSSRIVQQQLGMAPDRANDNLNALANFDKANAEFMKLISTSKTSTETVKRILGNLGAEYTGTERKVRDAIVKMIKAQQQLGGQNLANAANSLRSYKDALADAVTEQRKLESRQTAKSASAHVRSTLGTQIDRSKGNVLDVANFDKAEASFRKLVQTSGVSLEQVKRILANLGGSYSGVEQKIRDAILKIIQAQMKLGGTQNVEKAKAALKAYGDEATNAKKKIEDLANTEKRLQGRRNAVQSGNLVRDSLGPINRSASSVGDLARLDKATADFQKLVATSGASVAQVKKVLGNLSAEYMGTERKIRDAILKMVQAQARLGGPNAAPALALLKQLGDDGSKHINKATDASNKLFLSWQSVTRIFIGQAIFQSITRITGEISNATTRARELQIALAQIQTIAPPDLRNASLQDVGARTRSISTDFGLDQVEVARGAYEAFSNQVGNTAETFRFLQATADFATASVTKFAASGDLLAGVQNAYGLTANQADRLADVLFKTIDLGRVTGEEIANTLGRVAPVAAQLGISFEELAAGLATITIQGVKTDDALTQLQNIMKGLTKPTDAMKQKFKELGIASAEAGIQQYGFVGFLQELTRGADTVQKLATLFDDVRELRGVLSILTREGRLFADTLEQIENNAEGAASAASKLILDTPAAKLQKSIEAFKNVLTEEIGNRIITLLNGLIDTFGGAENAAYLLTSAIVSAAAVGGAAITGQLIYTIANATAAMFGLTLTFGTFALMTGGVGAVALAVGGLTYYLLNASDAADTLKKKFLDSEKEQQDALRETARLLDSKHREEMKQVNDRAATASSATSKYIQATQDYADKAKGIEKSITDYVKDQVRDRIAAAQKYVDKLVDSIDKADSKIKAATDKLRDIEYGVNQDRFERNLKSMGDNTDAQARSMIQRINQLRKMQNSASQSGDSEQSDFFNKEALNLAGRLADMQGKRRVGENEINKILQDRRRLTAQEIEKVKQEKAEAEKALPAAREQLKILEEQEDRIKEAAKALKEGSLSSKEMSENFNNLKQTVADFTALLKNFGIDDAKNFKDQLDKIRDDFSQNGIKVPLEILLDKDFNRVQQEVEKLMPTNAVGTMLKTATGIPQGPDQVQRVQDNIPKQTAALDKLNQTADKGKIAQEAYANSVKNVSEVMQQLRKETSLLSPVYHPEYGAIERESSGSKLTKNNVADVLQDVNKAIQDGDPTKLEDYSNRIREFTKSMGESSTKLPQLKKQLELLPDLLDKMAAEAKQVDEGKSAEQEYRRQETLNKLRDHALKLLEQEANHIEKLKSAEQTRTDLSQQHTTKHLEDSVKRVEAVKQENAEYGIQIQSIQRRNELLNQTIPTNESAPDIRPGQSDSTDTSTLKPSLDEASISATGLKNNLEAAKESAQALNSIDVGIKIGEESGLAESNGLLQQRSSLLKQSEESARNQTAVMQAGLTTENAQLATNVGSLGRRSATMNPNFSNGYILSGLAREAEALREVIRLLQIRNALAGGGGGGDGGQTAARGGMIHFFDRGGFAPRGTDTVSAMLTPGESVNTVAATRRFYSEIQAMNSSARSPASTQVGDTINNQFGDFNLNFSGGNPEAHGRQVVNQIRRELRRSSSKLN